MHPAIELLLTKLPEFEGNYPYMYLDTRGNVTTGIGHLISSLASAQLIPWEISGMRAPASRVATDWESVLGTPPAMVATYYASMSRCRLPSNWAIRDAAVILETICLPSVRRIMERNNFTFDNLPLKFQVVALDIQYNTGKLDTFKNFVIACRNRDINQAGIHCHRRGIGESRNIWCKLQLIRPEGYTTNG